VPRTFSAAHRPRRRRPVPASRAADPHLATITQYCAGCHNDRVKVAGISFDGLTADGIGRQADLFREGGGGSWRGRVMPPPNAPHPAPAAIDALITWLEASLDRAAAPSYLRDQMALHRLNRKEYANAVRDLLP